MPKRKTKEAKLQKVAEVTPAEVKQEEPQEVKPVEAKPQELSPPQPPKLEVAEAKLVIKEVKPATAPKPTAPVIKSISWEEFERFEESRSEKRSWIKVAIERARTEPVMLEGLSRGQIAALIRQVDDYNFKSSNKPKIQYKYDTKKGVVLLAPLHEQ
jgi:hypothetical protein